MQNGNPQNPYCAGIAGIMDAYHRTLQAVQLYGPTNFSPVINHVARHVSHHSSTKPLITFAKKVLFSLALICLSVSLFVSRIIQKLLCHSSQNLVEQWDMGHGRSHWIVVTCIRVG